MSAILTVEQRDEMLEAARPLMKATDFRDMTFEELQDKLSGMREKVYRAWLQHGPGTTAQVALRSQISLLTFRPRTTDLYQAGLLEIDPEDPRKGHEGRYRAISMHDWLQRKLAAEHPPKQIEMKLGV